MKRKYVIFMCAAAFLLSGCGTDSGSNVNVFTTGSAVTKSSLAQSTAASRSSSNSIESSSSSRSAASSSFSKSAASSPETSQPVSSTMSAAASRTTIAMPHGSSVVSETSIVSETSEVSVPPEVETQTVVYSYDPENACTITFDGTSVIVRGKSGDLLAGVSSEYPRFSVKSSTDGDETVYTLTPRSMSFGQRYGWFYILDKNKYKNYINVEMSANGIRFPDTSNLVKNNDDVINSAVNASAGKTLQFVTRNGKRDNAAHVLEDIKKISDEICEGIDGDYEKLRAISYWTSENIYYDYPAYNKGIPQECLSLEYMLDNRSSVCGGYSNMTSALCAAQGIRCLNITGSGIVTGQSFLEGVSGGFHEWNVAEIDGEYIIVDSGWNSHNYFNSDGTFTTDTMSYKYFDIGKEIFALDHQAQAAEYRDYWAVLEV